MRRTNRYFDSQGRTLFDRDVDLGVVVLPESAPTTINDGYQLGYQARPGGTAHAPYVVLMADFQAGTDPSVEFGLYLYFGEARDFTQKWQLIRVASINSNISSGPSFIMLPTLGAERYDVRVRSVTGSPEHIFMHARAINDDQARVLGMAS